MGMTHKVGVKGQVVIPKEIRDEIGIEPGDEVTFEPDGRDVRVRRVEDDRTRRSEGVKALRGIWADAPVGGTDELVEERRREREVEERKAQRWGVGRSR
jgi:AbrB family looped-hinge helix DNA binding protein